MKYPGIQTLQTFEQWMKTIDDLLFAETGLNYQDLPDQCFKDWFDEGLTPEAACIRCLHSVIQALF
jgi:hypothetical protein